MSTVQRAEPKLCEVVCPVEVIGRQLGQIIPKMVPMLGSGNAHIERHSKELYEAVGKLETAASYLRATSAYGAVLQLGLIRNAANTIADGDVDDPARELEAIRLLASSVADFISRSFVVDRGDYVLDYYITRSLDYLDLSAPPGGHPCVLPADGVPAE